MSLYHFHWVGVYVLHLMSQLTTISCFELYSSLDCSSTGLLDLHAKSQKESWQKVEKTGMNSRL